MDINEGLMGSPGNDCNISTLSAPMTPAEPTIQAAVSGNTDAEAELSNVRCEHEVRRLGSCYEKAVFNFTSMLPCMKDSSCLRGKMMAKSGGLDMLSILPLEFNKSGRIAIEAEVELAGSCTPSRPITSCNIRTECKSYSTMLRLLLLASVW